MNRLGCDSESSVPDWIVQYPETADVFHRFGLDVSCAGLSLRSACDRADLDHDHVVQALCSAVQRASDQTAADRNKLSPGDR